MRRFLVCCAAGLCAVSACAEDAAPDVVLPEVVVTPSRASRDIQSEPSTTYRIGGDATVAHGVRTTPDALQGMPSVMVQKTAYGQGSPFLRGFTGFRTLCLVEGIRLNNSVFRDGPNQYWNTVDPLSVEDYELVMGPGSVLYGSDAIGGILNALTVEPPDYDGKAAWERKLLYRGATADRSNVGRIQLGGRPSEQLGFVLGASVKDFGDLRGGKDVGRQERTGYDEQDYDARVDCHLDKDSSLTLGHQSVRQNDAWRTHRTIYGIDWEGLSMGDDKNLAYDQARDLTYLRYRADNMGGPVKAVNATVSRQVQGEDLLRERKDDKKDEQGFEVTTWGALLQFESDTAAGDWVYGAEYYRDDVSSYARKYTADGSLDKVEIQGPVADDATYDNAGAFVQNTLSLFDGALDVTPGARYTYIQADAGKVKDPESGKAMSIEDDWDALTASLRLLHPLTADRSYVVFAGVAQGFRAPNLSDLTRFDVARSGELETPAPDLEPEDYVTFEAGVKARAGKLVAQASCYYTIIDNMIVRAPTGRTVDENIEVTKKNSGEGYVQGAELSARYHFTPTWSSWINLAWMDGKVDAYPSADAETERDYITRLMPPTAQVGVRRQSENGRFWCEVVGDMAAKADKLSADDERDTQRIPPGGTPAYAVFAVRAGSRVTRNLDVSLALDNVLNEDYRIHGSGVNEPGRNLILTASCAF